LKHLKLQNFVTDVIEALGGVVIPVEYALCQVIVPDEFKDIFQGRTELDLAFDFEVAEENPQAEFVTFGSYLYEQIMALANMKAVSTLRFVEIDRLSLAHPLQKIQRFMQHPFGKITLLEERNVIGVWAVFIFKVSYTAEEKEEESREIWINLSSGMMCEEMQQNQHRIAYRNQPVYAYPLASEFSITSALMEAYPIVKEQAEASRKQRVDSSELVREIRRIEDYYADLAGEMMKRNERKSLTDQKKEEYKAKLQSIEREKEKQLREIENKYNVYTEVSLDHTMLYFVPQIAFSVQINFRSEQKVTILHYNPVLKRFTVAHSGKKGLSMLAEPIPDTAIYS
jgi:hypothetical protein